MFLKYMRWITGGKTGGGYGSDYKLRDITPEPEPQFEVLDLVLEKLKPDITYLQVKKILKLAKKGDYNNRDYYGNRDEYTTKYIVLSELIEKLEELG